MLDRECSYCILIASLHISDFTRYEMKEVLVLGEFRQLEGYFFAWGPANNG
jgi:hypothetical protein